MGDLLTVGVVVLCAKGDERVSIKKVLDTHFEPIRDRTSSFDQYILKTEPEEPNERLLLCDCADMGSTYSAARTGFVIGTEQPNLVLFVGTSGGLDADKFSVGDVFVPNGCVSRYYDKLSERGTDEFKRKTSAHGFQEYFLPKNGKFAFTQQNVLSGRDKSLDLTDVARRFISKTLANSFQEIEELLQTPLNSTRKAKIENDGLVFSSDWIINSVSYREFLRKTIDRKSIAVDMESFGFLQTINLFRGVENKVTNGIVVRGISDDASEKDESFDNGSAEIALYNASVVAVELIKRGYLS